MNLGADARASAGESRYRPDIDGLRAIAILIVVLYHAHAPGFGGGFVGVDVFFVISGYLIIGLLSREFERTGDLSLVDFFERRIRRLAPALMLVLAVTLVLGAIYLTPIGGEQQGLAKSAIATVMLMSNLYFTRTTGGYFDGPAEAQPLLHTWSLSVEEQFYLFWPLVVLAAGRYALRRRSDPMRAVLWALLGLLILSFVLSLWATATYPQSAFFAAPTRAWEFAVGGGMFFMLRNVPSPNRYGGWLAILGLVAIGAAATGFRTDMPFPGYLAVLPVTGTAVVILGCALAPGSAVARLLSLRPVVALGLVSYGWYLWHWPLLAIARVHTLGEIGAPSVAALCVLSLALAALTYRYVESPIRHKHVALMASRRRTFGVGATAILGIVALSAALGIYAKHVWPRQPTNLAMRDALGAMRKVRVACWQSRPYSGRLLEQSDCDQPSTNGPPQLLVWGDSHASHLVPMLSELATRNDFAIRIRFMPECPPLQDYSPTLIGVHRSVGCEQFNRDVLAEIAELRQRGLRHVVIAARWGPYLGNARARHVAEFGLQKTLAELQRMGIQTLVAASAPEYLHDVPACLSRRSIAECGLARTTFERERMSVMALLSDSIRKLANTRLVDPIAELCDTTFCPPIDARGVLYSDAHHLSEAGSLALLDRYATAIGRLPLGDLATAPLASRSVAR